MKDKKRPPGDPWDPTTHGDTRYHAGDKIWYTGDRASPSTRLVARLAAGQAATKRRREDYIRILAERQQQAHPGMSPEEADKWATAKQKHESHNLPKHEYRAREERAQAYDRGDHGPCR